MRYATVVIIILQYSLALTNLSSYNSPKKFPKELTGDWIPKTIDGENINRLNETVLSLGAPVYPTWNQTYYDIPWYFKVTPNSLNITFDGLLPE